MRFPHLMATAALLALTACGDIPAATPSSPTSTTTKPAPMPTTTTTTTVDPNVRTLNMARVLIVEADAQTAAHQSETRASHPRSRGLATGNGVYEGAPAVSGSLAGVVDCIKAHESGDYTEHSHLQDGSGAEQMIPSTFRAWQARWAAATGYSGPTYAYAYQAPPWMQDAITVFALTHGGAGNWSMRWGNDPCTRGLPGGG